MTGTARERERAREEKGERERKRERERRKERERVRPETILCVLDLAVHSAWNVSSGK